MHGLSQSQIDKMGLFNNQVVELVDSSPLTLPETIAVLRQIINKLEHILEVSVSLKEETK